MAIVLWPSDITAYLLWNSLWTYVMSHDHRIVTRNRVLQQTLRIYSAVPVQRHWKRKGHSGHRGGQKNILTAKTQTSGATIIVGKGYPIFDSHREFLLTEIRSSFSPFNCQWPDERKMRACRSLVLTVPEWLQDRSKRIWQSNPNNALYAPVTNTARFCRWGLWRSLCQKYCRSSLDVRL